MAARLPAQRCRWHPLPNADEIAPAAAQRILTAARDAIASRGKFMLVLAGGETPRHTYRLLRDAAADWSAWHIYFGDERCTPLHDPLRNSRMATQAWLAHVALPEVQVHIIPAQLGAKAAAHAYSAALHDVGTFDMVMLGLGEDGHTASLFPAHPWGTEHDAPDVLAIFDAPKPPPERVSLSAARLSDARQVLFLVTGVAKRAAVNAWCSGEALPARAITPANGIDVLVEAVLLH